MLSATPTVIIESGTDWPAITASISTGVAAVAGIIGTLWQAGRSRTHDDNRARTTEKRGLYAKSLTTLNAGLRAAIVKHSQLEETAKVIRVAEKNLKDAEPKIKENPDFSGYRDYLRKEVASAQQKQADQIEDYKNSLAACIVSYSELSLIASSDVIKGVRHVIEKIQEYSGENARQGQLALAGAMLKLRDSMRVDLGEYPLPDVEDPTAISS